jgi:hypothetical protein
MPQEPSAVEQAIARALRDNLTTLQRSVTELEQAVSDLVAVCASSRPANALPSMLRAQTASASLEASLSVMSRFIAASMQPAMAVPGMVVEPAPTADAEPESAAESAAEAAWEPAPDPVTAPPPPEAQLAAADMVAEGAPVMPPEQAIEPAEPPLEPEPAAFAEDTESAPPAEPPFAPPAPPAFEEPQAAEVPGAEPAPVEEETTVPAAVEFDISTLQPEEQVLHRRANRVAKVSMQDIQMLHPDTVAQGRENRDLCGRLREDIDKARREYDRRFQPILHHPVDYFYHWMVEILANGDPEALGEYPYPSPLVRR